MSGATTVTALTATGSSQLNSVHLTGPLSGEAAITATQFISTVSSGHAPFVVSSSTLVPGLHADNSDNLGGNAPGFYLNSSATAQTKAGLLSVGSLNTGGLTDSGSGPSAAASALAASPP